MFASMLNLALALLLTKTTTLTTSAAPTSGTPSTTAVQITVSQLTTISPKSAACPSSGQHTNECRTAAQAVDPINAAFQTYGITSPGVAAAVLATMAFESGDFEYCVHHFPSPNPGQGTRNMQSYAYNLKYAQSIPGLASGLPAAQEAGPDAVLALLTTYDDYDFGSASWFLTTQCDQSVQDGLVEGGASAFAAYAECTKVTVTDARMAYYTAALTALGVLSGS